MGEGKISRELKFLYDEGADVLYVSLGHPEYTDYAKVNDDLILRFDPETKEIVGFTIIDFLAHFSQPKPPLRIPLEASFQPLGGREKTDHSIGMLLPSLKRCACPSAYRSTEVTTKSAFYPLPREYAHCQTHTPSHWRIGR